MDIRLNGKCKMADDHEPRIVEFAAGIPSSQYEGAASPYHPVTQEMLGDLEVLAAVRVPAGLVVQTNALFGGMKEGGYGFDFYYCEEGRAEDYNADEAPKSEITACFQLHGKHQLSQLSSPRDAFLGFDPGFLPMQQLYELSLTKKEQTPVGLKCNGVEQTLETLNPDEIASLSARIKAGEMPIYNMHENFASPGLYKIGENNYLLSLSAQQTYEDNRPIERWFHLTPEGFRELEAEKVGVKGTKIDDTIEGIDLKGVGVVHFDFRAGRIVNVLRQGGIDGEPLVLERPQNTAAALEEMGRTTLNIMKEAGYSPAKAPCPPGY